MTIISENRTFTDGRSITRFKLETDVKPTKEDVCDSQMRCGYHPAGYGGPYDIRSTQVDNHWLTIWYCAGSCD